MCKGVCVYVTHGPVLTICPESSSLAKTTL